MKNKTIPPKRLPQKGDTRVRKRFSLIPRKLVDVNSGNYYWIFFEHYYIKQIYKEVYGDYGTDKMSWVTTKSYIAL